MKLFVSFALVFLSAVSDVYAQERGIGVSPANIEIGQNVEWPYTVDLAVTNLSSETENFEVTFDKNAGVVVSALPGRFSLKSGERGLVMVTFEEPRRRADGLVKIVSTKTSPDGFTTGTGVKLPFRVEAQGDNKKFLAGVNEAFGGFGGFHQLFGAGMILVTLVLLWYFSGMVRTWISNFEKH